MAHDSTHQHQTPLRRWRPAILAAAALLIVVSIAFAGRDGSSTGTTSTTVGASTTTQPFVALKRTLVLDSVGDDVKMVQQRLKDIGFDPNLIDGDFGYQTLQAVWAFQKLVMKIPISGVKDKFTPEMWEVAQRDNLVMPRRPDAQTATHVEVYLPEQVLVIFKRDDKGLSKPVLITHISTGSGEDWCEAVTIDPGEQGNLNGKEAITKGICGKALTPGGLFYFYNRKPGTRQSKLGTMWNPVYFNGGIAVHGAAQVPIRPASHGCVRIPMFISEYLPSLVAYGDRVYVFDGVKQPEEYGAPLPPADRPDPNYTTTTSEPDETTTTVGATSTTAVGDTTTSAPKKSKQTTSVPEQTTTVAPTTSTGG